MPTSRHTVGVLGLLGILLLATWLIGWAAFGAHAGLWHALVPLGAFLIIVQGVRRVNTEPGDGGE